MPDEHVTYEVTEDGVVTFTDEDGRTWLATACLRFKECSNGTRTLRILQQLFICDDEPTWCDVPLERV